MKIGVFDSGVGGLTVLLELRRAFPDAQYVYLGDTANVPYGTKSPAQIERLSQECARQLKERGIDALVVACNTASSLALPAIRAIMGPVPVHGVVIPGVEAALEALNKIDAVIAPILVLATRATIQSQAYGNSLREMLAPSSASGGVPCPIIEQACPLLVPMIEEGWINHPILHQTIQEYVAPHVRTQEPGVALLGCTHYPWIQDAFEKALPGWKVVNSAQSIAERLRKDSGAMVPQGGKGAVEWIFTDPEAVPAFARALMQKLST